MLWHPKTSVGNYSAEFKTKVGLAALREQETTVQLVQRFDVHPHQITAWKRQLLDGAVEVFETGSRRADESEEVIKEFHVKIGALTMEHDFLSHGLVRYDW